MAFGFGFNKQKVLSAAEKFVQQGKLPNAITEYEKVLKADPKDLTVMNTVGDLYARLGQNDKAVEAFKNVGDAYAGQGFTVKAIAMYKKLSKIRPSLEGSLRLAELYTQQGLFNDSRAQYLQVAEEFLRAGELEQAVRIFQKTLEMDPENVAMRTRLAEVYVRLGKKTEAWQIFIAAAESLRAKGQLGPAEDILQRMLTLDPNNGYVLLLRGRTALDSGDLPQAIENLEKVSDLDSHPDGLRALFQAYLQSRRLQEAGTLAAKLAAVHNDTACLKSYASALISGGNYEAGLRVYQQHADSLLASDATQILEGLHAVIGHVRDNPAALEILSELFNKAGDTTHNTEVYELLAHAYTTSGDSEKARPFYLKLTQLEPQNQLHAKNYQRLMSTSATGSGAHLITAEEGTVLIEELESTAPFVDQRYRDELALELRAALTDAELFISYNMPEKALGPLLSALPQAPRDLRLNQRLAALHTRAERFAEAGGCCRTLESIYDDAGHPDEASRYGELAQKYEDRVSVVPQTDPSETEFARTTEEHQPGESAEFQISPAEVESNFPGASASAAASETQAAPASGLFFHTPAAEPAGMASGEFEVQNAPSSQEPEIDLSAEWEGEISGDNPAAESVESVSTLQETSVEDDPESVELAGEIRFYLAHGMADQADAAYAKLEQLNPGASTLSALREEIAAAKQSVAQAEPELTEEVAPEVAEISAIAEIAPAIPELQLDSATPSHTQSYVADELVADLQESTGIEIGSSTAGSEIPTEPQYPTFHAEGTSELPAEVAESQPEPIVEPAQTAAAETKPQVAETLGDFVADLEASLGDSFLPASKVETPVAAPAEISMGARAGAGHSPTLPAVTAPSVSHAPTPVASSAPAQHTPAAPLASPALSTQAGIDLADMFGELKQELEEGSATAEEDPETHYNLGVAFREMGLLDEAIGELQKVCQSIDRGHKFPQVIQTYTWLAQCFLDKGIPDAAIRWYEKALAIPKLDDEARTALYYELAACYESAGNKKAALSNFMQVYGSNIDYRDVAERITALKS
ncbi:MAG: hypothetical protein NVS9B5_25800 [Terriglobales bacterium]